MADAATIDKYAIFTRFKQQYIARAELIEEALTFYKNAFGAVEIARYYAPNERHRLVCVELKLGGSTIVVTVGPDEITRSKISAIVETAEFEHSVAGAIAAGGIAAGAVQVQNLSKTCGGGGDKRRLRELRDPCGSSWVLASTSNKSLCPLCCGPSHVPALCWESRTLIASRSWGYHNSLSEDVIRQYQECEYKLKILQESWSQLEDLKWDFYEIYSERFSRNKTVPRFIDELQRLNSLYQGVDVAICFVPALNDDFTFVKDCVKVKNKYYNAVSLLRRSSPDDWDSFQSLREDIADFHRQIAKRWLTWRQVVRGKNETIAAFLRTEEKGMQNLIGLELDFWRTQIKIQPSPLQL